MKIGDEVVFRIGEYIQAGVIVRHNLSHLDKEAQLRTRKFQEFCEEMKIPGPFHFMRFKCDGNVAYVSEQYLSLINAKTRKTRTIKIPKSRVALNIAR